MPGYITPVPAQWSTANDLHEDLVTLTSWMLRGAFSAEDIVDRVQEPWKYLEEIQAARVDLDPAEWCGREV